MQRVEHKNVIIGAGAMGSAAAYHLAKRGEPVALIEQFAIGHDRGSSHGAARITRHSYADARYARLMPAAFRAWRDLEADSGEPIYIRTGGVTFCPASSDYVGQISGNLAELDVPYRRMTGAEFNRVLPTFSVPGDYEVVFEPDAGMLTAGKAVALQVQLAQQFGGDRTTLLTNTPVRRIDLEGTRPVVVTDTQEILAERLILSAGSWLPRLYPGCSVPLKATRQQVLYFRPADPVPFEIGRFPVFIFKGDGEGNAFYGMPQFQGLGVKVARHFGPDVNPDDFEPVVGEEYRGIVRDFLRRHIPGIADTRIDLTEVCLYTVAPEEEFLISMLPGRGDVVIASPCSGHGFKFSCLIGQALADLAVDGSTDRMSGILR